MVDAVIALSRGGTYVRTSVGAIQFGVPPESIKDVMGQKLDNPVAYVLPNELFDRRRGLSVAEFEFPAYYNFFILRRRTRFVVHGPAIEARVRAVFQETLFGPAHDASPSEYADDYPEELRPNLVREAEAFRKQSNGRSLEIDDLAEFVHLDMQGMAHIGDSVRIAYGADGYTVTDGAAVVARVGAQLQLPARPSRRPLAPNAFAPPGFGITVLGASHGFDPTGKTTGFILWMGGRGLLVDPPVDTTAYLAENGIAPKLIDGVILTHCHADHDAGTFQKLLEEQKVLLYTTPHVLGSFLRKYSSLSGLSETLLRRTFAFQPARIGAPVRVHGGEIWFQYTLHSIPALGFHAHYGGKSIAFSGDTLFDPVRIRAMQEQGVLSEARARELSTFPADCGLVLHEAGIPPLHTPVAVLAELSDDAKSRLRLVHIASKDIPPDRGLVAAPVGLENTLRIDVAAPTHGDAIALLDALCGVDFIRDLPLSRARELLQVAHRVSFRSGERIVTKGTRGDAFYVIANGRVGVIQDGRAAKTYQAGDYFGETALILGQPRNADVVAQTDVELIMLERGDFLSLLRGNDIRRRLTHLAQIRAVGAWEVMEKNSVLHTLSSAQKTQLQALLEPRDVIAHETLWSPESRVENAVLLDDAAAEIEGLGVGLAPFSAGAFLGEIDALRAGDSPTGTARITRAGRLFVIDRASLCRFFDENPGVLLLFVGTRFME